ALLNLGHVPHVGGGGQGQVVLHAGAVVQGDGAVDQQVGHAEGVPHGADVIGAVGVLGVAPSLHVVVVVVLVEVVTLVVDLDGLGGAVLKDNVQLQGVLADGVGGQNQHVVGGHGVGLSLEQDHAGQVGGHIGAVGLLLQHGVDLDVGVLVNVAHLVPAGGHAVDILVIGGVVVVLGIQVVVEGHGVQIHRIGLARGAGGQALAVHQLRGSHGDAAIAVVVAAGGGVLEVVVVDGV